ncbi:hypothetical protein CCMSSC00406_0003641 [Pleurotus cornucopiae]|uniref:Uncharacterized protein n=1 Tax=Pleurotus cornucopiae TaxID=5321 RepID=A0ACB7IHN3_PLECO|nr:hypothetical protein CCMSSC00406_0003641 [Pleurotus cornucopiae]
MALRANFRALLALVLAVGVVAQDAPASASASIVDFSSSAVLSSTSSVGISISVPASSTSSFPSSIASSAPVPSSTSAPTLSSSFPASSASSISSVSTVLSSGSAVLSSLATSLPRTSTAVPSTSSVGVFSPFPTPSQAPVRGVFEVTDPSRPPPVNSPIIPDFNPAWAEAYAKARTLIANFSIEEKVNITTGVGWMNGLCVGNIPPVQNWPGLCLEDSPLGVRFGDFSTAFPTAINAAATWNRRLIRLRGLFMGQEHVGKGVNVALGPMMNMGRVANGGRNWEGFGADPFLAGEAAYETILGMQEAGVQACAKHFINNEQEHKRTESTSDVDDRTQHEIYAHPFLKSVMAGVASVMCSYNQINGTFACENDKMLNDVLKREFGFQGYVMSDWQATHSTHSANDGLDMTMPGDITFNSGDSWFGGNLTTSVRDNQTPEARLDDMATRIIAAWYLLNQQRSDFPTPNFDAFRPDNEQTNFHIDVQDDHGDLVREMGAASTVLLKNVRGALPLKKPRSLVLVGSDAGPGVIGPNHFSDQGGVDGVLAMGWGSGTANFTYLVSPYEAISARARKDHTTLSWIFDDFNLARAGNMAIGRSAALVFLNSDSGEGYITVDGNEGDRRNLTAWHGGDNLVNAVAAQNNNTIVVVHSVGPLILEPWIEHPNVTAVVLAGVSGTETGNSLVDILYGAWNPSGRLPYTIAKRPEDYSAQLVLGGGGAENIIPIPYTEGLEIDYRHFDAKNITPRFEFGFGLSYTTFEYSNLKVSKIDSPDHVQSDLERAWAAGKASPYGQGSSTALYLHRPAFRVTFDVKNTGKLFGGDIPQLYVNMPASSGEPPSILKGFTNIELSPNERRTVTINLSRYDLSIWDTAAQGILDALDRSMALPSAGAIPSDDNDDGPSNAAMDATSSGSPAPTTFSLSQVLTGTSSPSKSPAALRTSGGIAGGFHLNYDQETPLRSVDVGGEDQQQKLAEFVTKAIDNLSHGITVRDAMKDLGLRDKTDFLPGLDVRLLPHQVIGVSWMVAQESSTRRGGILADDMGLGKTVQMIATMVINQPEPDADCRVTLVVVPAALLQQWKDEIDTKTNGIFETHVHHGKDKIKKLSELQSKDVIITSYPTLCQDFWLPKDLEPGEEAEYLAREGGILARAKFFRVVADEAQFIRNRSTRASTSLAYIRSIYRWMLTGTPVTNTLADIYGLLRFGRFRPWNDWNDFNAYVAKVQYEDAPLAGQRAQAILEPLVLRRTKNSTLEGEPILQLPPKDIELCMLEFSEEERDLYDSFEKRSKIRLSKFIKERTLVKNHAIVLVMILRLRQLCCHPNLILRDTDDFEDPTLLMAGDGEKELSRAIKFMADQVYYAEVKKRFLERSAASELIDFADMIAGGNDTCPVCHDLYANGSGRIIECGHELCFGIIALFINGLLCSRTIDCLLELSNAAVTHDGIFGYGSEKQNMEVERAYEEAATKGLRPCPTCKKMCDFNAANRVFKSIAFEPSDEELTAYANAHRRGSRRHQVKYEIKDEDDEDNMDVDVDISESLPTPNKIEELSEDELPDASSIFAPKAKRAKISEDGDRLNLFTDRTRKAPVRRKTGSRRSSGVGPSPETKVKPKRNFDDGPSDEVIATWRKGDDDLEASTKMLAMIDLLKKSSDDKTICYSQWTTMLDLIDKLFSRHGIQCLRYDGRMDRPSREAALTNFKRPGGPKVILVSTRCGGVGLNLVVANRVINMDLSWNYAAESQAYDRVHRLGQEKDVFVKRLVVRNTIEERMLKLQDVKTGLAEAALGEGSGGKLHRLSVKDIKHLFGMTSTTPAEDEQQQRLANTAGRMSLG